MSQCLSGAVNLLACRHITAKILSCTTPGIGARAVAFAPFIQQLRPLLYIPQCLIGLPFGLRLLIQQLLENGTALSIAQGFPLFTQLGQGPLQVIGRGACFIGIFTEQQKAGSRGAHQQRQPHRPSQNSAHTGQGPSTQRGRCCIRGLSSRCRTGGLIIRQLGGGECMSSAAQVLSRGHGCQTPLG